MSSATDILKWINDKNPEFHLRFTDGTFSQNFKLVTQDIVVYGRFYGSSHAHVEIQTAAKLFMGVFPYNTIRLNIDIWSSYANEPEARLKQRLQGMYAETKKQKTKNDKANFFT